MPPNCVTIWRTGSGTLAVPVDAGAPAGPAAVLAPAATPPKFVPGHGNRATRPPTAAGFPPKFVKPTNGRTDLVAGPPVHWRARTHNAGVAAVASALALRP